MLSANVGWDDLRVFLQVARFHSLTAAAPGLKCDPATIGRRVSRLEDQLDTRLFVRSPQGYEITASGEALLEKVEQMELALRGAEIPQVGTSRGLVGAIRIGAPDGSANYLLPQVCAEISDENPNLDIQIVALPRVLNLSKREADMAITVSPPKEGRLSVQKISDYKLHLAATSEYLDTHPTISSVEDLKKHRLIGYISDLIFADELDYSDQLGDKARTQLTSNSFSVQLNWARRGNGVCIVHDFAMPTFPDLQKILTDQVSLTRSFYLVRHADDRRNARLKRFAELLVPKLRNEVKRLEAAA
jgi:DNA-binding transcriptional LysR family regulator